MTDWEEWREDGRALRIVSPAYAGRDGELGATLQYVYQACMLEGCGEKECADELMRIAKDEMRHLRLLGVAVAKLGAQPLFSACPPYPVSFYCTACINYACRLPDMLRADICGEEKAIADYTRMLCRLENRPAAELIRHILEEEEGHLARLREMLAR